MEITQYSQNNPGPTNPPGQNTGNDGRPPQGMPPQGMRAHGMPPQGMPPQKGNMVMGDNINTLPTDKNNPSEVDQNIANTIFGENLSITQKLVKEGKDMFIIGLLFVVFSLPQLDDIIKKFIPITVNSIYMLILIKAILLMVIFWLIKHFYLSRK